MPLPDENRPRVKKIVSMDKILSKLGQTVFLFEERRFPRSKPILSKEETKTESETKTLSSSHHLGYQQVLMRAEDDDDDEEDDIRLSSLPDKRLST